MNTKKDVKEIQNEIRAVLRQIIASVTFLPALEDTCNFPALNVTNNSNPFFDRYY